MVHRSGGRGGGAVEYFRFVSLVIYYYLIVLKLSLNNYRVSAGSWPYEIIIIECHDEWQRC